MRQTMLKLRNKSLVVKSFNHSSLDPVLKGDTQRVFGEIRSHFVRYYRPTRLDDFVCLGIIGIPAVEGQKKLLDDYETWVLS